MRRAVLLAVRAGEDSVLKGDPTQSTSRYRMTDMALRGWVERAKRLKIPVLHNHEGDPIGSVTKWRYAEGALMADVVLHDNDVPCVVGQPVSMTTDLHTRFDSNGRKVATTMVCLEISLMDHERGAAFASSKVLAVEPIEVPAPAPAPAAPVASVTALAGAPYVHTGRARCPVCGATGPHDHGGTL